MKKLNWRRGEGSFNITAPITVKIHAVVTYHFGRHVPGLRYVDGFSMLTLSWPLVSYPDLQQAQKFFNDPNFAALLENFKAACAALTK